MNQFGDFTGQSSLDLLTVPESGGFGAFGVKSSLDVLTEENERLRPLPFVGSCSSIIEEDEEDENRDIANLPESCQRFIEFNMESLRSELQEAQKHSARNHQQLLEFGQFGQQLVAEETRLQERLSACHDALAKGEGPEPGSWDLGKLRRLSSDSGLIPLAFGAAPSMAYVRSVKPSASKRAMQQISRDQQEIDRLRSLNAAMEEEIEERELALAKILAGGDGQHIDELDDDLRRRVSVLQQEFHSETKCADRSELGRQREIRELERESTEVKKHSASMLAVIQKHLNATRQKNAELMEELASEQSKKSHHSPLHDVIKRLQQELAKTKQQNEKVDAEIRKARSEVADAENNHFEAQAQAIDAKAEAMEAKLSARIEARHRMARARVVDVSHQDSNTTSEDSEGSEMWDGGVTQATSSERNALPKALARRRRNRQQKNQFHTDVEIVVHTAKPENHTPRPEAALKPPKPFVENSWANAGWTTWSNTLFPDQNANPVQAIPKEPKSNIGLEQNVSKNENAEPELGWAAWGAKYISPRQEQEKETPSTDVKSNDEPAESELGWAAWGAKYISPRQEQEKEPPSTDVNASEQPTESEAGWAAQFAKLISTRQEQEKETPSMELKSKEESAESGSGWVSWMGTTAASAYDNMSTTVPTKVPRRLRKQVLPARYN